MMLELEEAMARVENKLKERQPSGNQDEQEKEGEPASTVAVDAGDQVATSAMAQAAPNQAMPSEVAPLPAATAASAQPMSSMAQPEQAETSPTAPDVIPPTTLQVMNVRTPSIEAPLLPQSHALVEGIMDAGVVGWKERQPTEQVAKQELEGQKSELASLMQQIAEQPPSMTNAAVP